MKAKLGLLVWAFGLYKGKIPMNEPSFVADELGERCPLFFGFQPCGNCPGKSFKFRNGRRAEELLLLVAIGLGDRFGPNQKVELVEKLINFNDDQYFQWLLGVILFLGLFKI